MSEIMQKELHGVIDEMSIAYKSWSDYDYMNADYAEFAKMALGRFRTILGNPSLTEDELGSTLRKLIAQHKNFGAPGCWKGFVATKMVSASNSNEGSYI